ncbi:MAG TPA: hypothetical protein VIK28_04755 [Sedimentisphaerales bacterium]
MRRNAAFNHKHLARRKRRAVIAASGLLRPFFFIVTAIIAAGIGAAIIKAYQGELASIWAPQIAIETPEFRAINAPHDDICDNVFDNYNFNGTKNIKGFSESSIINNDCVFRQMGNGLDLGD